MQKRTIDPWPWGLHSNSVQAVEIKQPAGTLYCSGQVAIHADGQPSTGDMRAQFQLILQNLEQLIRESEYECSGIVRLNIYTTSIQEFFTACVDLYQGWVVEHGIKQATTLVEVQGLYAGLSL